MIDRTLGHCRVCINVPQYLLSMSLQKRIIMNLGRSARPVSWYGRNDHSIGQPGGTTEGGGSVVAGTMGDVGICPVGTCA